MGDDLPMPADDEPRQDRTEERERPPSQASQDNRRSRGSGGRRGFMKGIGLGVLGTGVIGGLGFGAGVYMTERFYRGGDAENSTDVDPRGGPGAGDFSNGDSQNGGNGAGNESGNVSSPGNETDTGVGNESDETDNAPDNETDTGDESDPGDGDTDGDEETGIPDPGVDPVYSVDGEVEVELDDLDSVYSDSSVVMGVQDDGDLVAWNVEVENDDGYNPLWRFSSDQFPNSEFYDFDEHPIEAIYDELDVDIDTMSESMVNIFYDGDDWESESEYKEIEFEDLKNGLLEYSGPGPAQDYFFNRSATLSDEEPVLETEWQELLQDGL